MRRTSGGPARGRRGGYVTGEGAWGSDTSQDAHWRPRTSRSSPVTSADTHVRAGAPGALRNGHLARQMTHGA
ncbi:hypothetical protein GCM10027091_23810 [Streptomyces daliensis]